MKNYAKGLLLLCMVIVVCVSCSQKAGVNQAVTISAEPETTVTSTPAISVATEQTVSENTLPTVEAEELDSVAAQKASKETQYAKWEYDKKTHCLIISGKGETHDDVVARDGSEDDRTGKFSTDEIANLGSDFNRDNVKEVIVKQGVTAINTAAFAFFTNVEKVTIPSSVKKMGAYVFYECESLKEITIPDSVSSIDVECFYGCKSLTKITFGKKVKTIEAGNFAGCDSLREINVKSGNKNLVTKEGILYQKNKKILYFAYANTENVKIPKGTKKIGACAFYMNPKLRTVVIPASVTVIDGGAFYQCKMLENVTFAKQSKCEMIKDYTWDYDGSGGRFGCFKLCRKLKELIFPENLKYIGTSSLIDCSSLEKVYFGKSFEGQYETDDPQIYSHEFIGEKSQLKEIVISKKNKYYSSEAGVMFDKDKETLLVYPRKKAGQKYVIPKSVKKIEYHAFRKCKNLKSVIFYSENIDIHKEGFLGCKKNITLYGKENSTVQRFAENHRMKFAAM